MYLPSSRRLLGAAALLCLALLVSTASALRAQQGYTIQGTVVDAATQQPLSSVSVVLRGSGLGTLTNQNGQYTLIARVPAGTYTVQYSVIGRREASRQITLGDERVIRMEPVTLQQSAVELDEIVVTGQGAPTERRAVGNAVASIAGEQVSGAAGASAVDQALQGKVVGAVISENSGQPGGGVSIRLRGTSSILGGAEPLIVVDGVIIDNSNEALVSLGSNATTSGAGLTNRLADISPGDIERIEVLKGAAAAALYGSKANSGVIQIFTKRGSQGTPRINFSTDLEVGETPNRYELNMAPTAGFTDVLFGLAPSLGAPVERFDIQDQIFRTAYSNNTRVSVSGGSEGTSYFLSGQLQNDQGILENTDYGKKSVRGKITQQVSELLEVTLNGNYIDSDAHFIPEGEQTQGVLTSVLFTPTTFNPARSEQTGLYPYNPILGANPLNVLENFRAEEEVVRFIGSAEATLRPLSNLTVRYLLGLDDYRLENTYLQPPRSTRANFTGSIENPVLFSRQVNSDLIADHNFFLNDAVELNTTAGFRYTSDRSERINSTALDLPPGTELVQGARQFTSQSLVEINTVSGFVQERVSLGDRLFITGGLNVEASSAFGEDQRWQLFPRLGLSWLVSDENAWEAFPLRDVFSTLRLRAAYGETGGQPPDAYGRFQNFVDVNYAGLPGFRASTRLGNPDLKPERQREYEAGLEAGFLNDRVSLEFTYYDQRTSDLVLSVPVSPTTGAQNQFQNIGAIRNRGIEGALSTVNVARPSFSWNSRLTFAANRNRVEELVTDADTIQTRYLNVVAEGQPVGVFYGRYYERDAQGNIVYTPRTVTTFGKRETLLLPTVATDANGRPLQRILGDPNPDWTASLNNTFTLGQSLELSFLLDGRFGNDIWNGSRRILELFGAAKVVEREITGDTVFRTFSLNPAGRSLIYEEYIEDGSFVKLREISARYHIGENIARRFGVEGMNLRVAARNLYTWTDYSGLDPEVNLFSANTVARGVDFGTTPIPRTLIVGVDFFF